MNPGEVSAPVGRRAPSRAGERLLGAFVIFQLVAIPLGSFIKLIPVRIPERVGELTGELQQPLPADQWSSAKVVQPVFDTVAWVSARWAEVSGQRQSWALFATFNQQSVMTTVELRWPAGSGRAPVVLYNQLEPDDPASYFQLPKPRCRLWNYEYRMCIFHWARSLEELAAEPDRFGPESVKAVANMHRSLVTYLGWRADRYRAAHPDSPPPSEVVLLARIFPTPRPGTSNRERSALIEMPVARWRPGDTGTAERMPIEAWDPVKREFVALAPWRSR